MKKCSFVTLIGAPNAGKSTLVNRLVGSKVSIVTPKVQTTRNSLRGICMHEETQLVLIDTPGIFKPQRSLERAIVSEAVRNIGESDELVVLIDAKKGICKDTRIVIEDLKRRHQKAIIALNKVDLIAAERLLPLIKELNEYEIFVEIFMISALKGEGVLELKQYLVKTAPEGEWMFPEDQLSDASSRFTVAETTRETLFMKLQNELPYSLTVETEQFEEDKRGTITIRQIIYVSKESHKIIVLGKGGSLIKDVGTVARKKMQGMFDTKVNLFLFVKVKEGWTENPASFSQVGLDFADTNI